MSYIELNRLEILIDIFEHQQRNVFSVSPGWTFGIPASEVYKKISYEDVGKWKEWLEVVDYLSVIDYPVEGEIEYVDVSRTDEPGEIFLENLLIEEPYVSDNNAAIYRVKEEVLFEEIARRLNLTGTIKGHTISLLQNNLWCLGTLELGGDVNKEIYVVRGLRDSTDEILDVLENFTRGGVVLLAGNRNPKRLAWPSGVVAQLVIGAIRGDGLKFEYKLPWLNSVAGCKDALEHRPREVSKPVKDIPVRLHDFDPLIPNESILDEGENILFSYDWNRKILSIPGKDDWMLQDGTRQVSIVEFLVKQARAGVWEIKNKIIIEATNPRHGGAHHIKIVFSGNKKWLNYICSNRRGYWGLNLEREKCIS